MLDPTSIQQAASQAIAKLKAAGVTTVLLSADPIAPRDFTREATAQQYFPEWMLAAVTLADTTAFARTYDQEQWAHAFGSTALAARMSPSAAGTTALYEWYNGEPPPAPDQIGIIAPYPAVFFGVSKRGPDLTRVRGPSAEGRDRDDSGHHPAVPLWGGPDLGRTSTPASTTRRSSGGIRRDRPRRDPPGRHGMWRYADGGARSCRRVAGHAVSTPRHRHDLGGPSTGRAPPDYPSPAG